MIKEDIIEALRSYDEVSIKRAVAENCNGNINSALEIMDYESLPYIPAKKGFKDALEYLHDQYPVDLNIISGIEGLTPLAVACKNDHGEMADFLVTNVVNTDWRRE